MQYTTDDQLSELQVVRESAQILRSLNHSLKFRTYTNCSKHIYVKLVSLCAVSLTCQNLNIHQHILTPIEIPKTPPMANISITTNSNKIKYKLVFLGNQSVGKSSIIEKYIHNKFDESSNPTVGIDFLAKNTTHRSKNFRLQLWDTAGQERFKSLIPSYLKDAICAIIVYDVTNQASLADAQKWVKLYNQNRTIDGYTILVGNKIDLPYRTITNQQGQQFATKLGIDHYTLSAKTGQNVQSLFIYLIDRLLDGKNTTPPSGGMGSEISTASKQYLGGNGVPEAIAQDKKQQQTEVDQTHKKFKDQKFAETTDVIEGTTKPPPKNIVLNSAPVNNRRAETQKCC